MKEEMSSNDVMEGAMPSSTKTILWLGLGVIVYIVIQWMVPKAGVHS